MSMSVYSNTDYRAFEAVCILAVRRPACFSCFTIYNVLGVLGDFDGCISPRSFRAFPPIKREKHEKQRAVFLMTSSFAPHAYSHYWSHICRPRPVRSQPYLEVSSYHPHQRPPRRCRQSWEWEGGRGESSSYRAPLPPCDGNRRGFTLQSGYKDGHFRTSTALIAKRRRRRNGSDQVGSGLRGS